MKTSRSWGSGYGWGLDRLWVQADRLNIMAADALDSCVTGICDTHYGRTRPTLERRKTLGHPRSINRNMIIHFANQSHIHRPANFWKLKKKILFKYFMTRNCEKWCNQSDIENPYWLSRASYIYIYVCVWHFNDISQVCKPSEFTGWAIIEELSIRRRLHTFLISWGQKTRVKHCYVDLSSWYEFWFAIICIGTDVILDLSTTIQQF